jgi:hypothetical protein
MPVPDEAVLRQLHRIVDSATFRNAERLRDFLRFVVEETLAGRKHGIKERGRKLRASTSRFTSCRPSAAVRESSGSMSRFQGCCWTPRFPAAAIFLSEWRRATDIESI